LALTIKPHPKLYKIQLINNCECIIVKDQARVPMSIGKYEE